MLIFQSYVFGPLRSEKSMFNVEIINFLTDQEFNYFLVFLDFFCYLTIILIFWRCDLNEKEKEIFEKGAYFIEKTLALGFILTAVHLKEKLLDKIYENQIYSWSYIFIFTIIVASQIGIKLSKNKLKKN